MHRICTRLLCSWHRPYDLGCGHCLCQRCYVNWSGKKLCPACRKEWKAPHVAFDLLGAVEAMTSLRRRLRVATASSAALATMTAAAAGTTAAAGSPLRCSAGMEGFPSSHGCVPVTACAQDPRHNDQEERAPRAPAPVPTAATASGAYSAMLRQQQQQQRARRAAASASLAGRIRHRLGLEGLGEAEMSLREVSLRYTASHGPYMALPPMNGRRPPSQFQPRFSTHENTFS